MARSITDELKMLDTALGRAMTRVLANGDVPYSQAGVLLYLAERSGLATSHRQIEEHFGISNPATSGLVKRLEAKGYVQVRIDAADKRYRSVYITEAGQKAMQKAEKQVESVDRQIFSGFSSEEAQQALVLVQRMRENLL